jgi:predicted cupin superfamily sugar epimerase
MEEITSKFYIDSFKMIPHPEGGYFANKYQANSRILYSNKEVELYSSIYYLLESGEKSCFHRLNTDEIWHFYDGCPIVIHELNQNLEYQYTILGKDAPTPNFQYLIKAGTWFAATPMLENSFSLIGCTLSPAFTYDGFEIASRQELLDLYPQHQNLINTFTNK